MFFVYAVKKVLVLYRLLAEKHSSNKWGWMKILTNNSIKFRIWLSYIAILFLFFSAGMYFFHAASKISRASRSIELQSFTEVELVTSLETVLYQLGHISVMADHTLDGRELLKYKNDVEIKAIKFKVMLAEYSELVKNQPVFRKEATAVGSLFNKYTEMINDQIDNNSGQANSLLVEMGLLQKELQEKLKGLRDKGISVLSSNLAEIDYLSLGLRQSYSAAFLFVFILAVIIAFFLVRSILNPLNVLLVAQEKVGLGNFDYKISVKSNDEIGRLQKSFMSMAERLKLSLADLYRQKYMLEKNVQERTKVFEQTLMYLEEVTNGVEEGIMLVDSNFKVLWANKKVLVSCGLEPGEVVGDFCYKITHHRQEPCSSSQESCPVKEILKTGKSATFIHTHYGKDGSKYYVEVSAYPLPSKPNELMQFVHVTRDITDKIRLESSLENSMQKMKEKMEELERFHKLVVDRELRMVDLKDKIADLEQKLKDKQ